MAIEVFEKEIVNEIKRGNLSIFAGAGLSIGSGYKSWKELLREIASDIGLNIDKESDLIAVAQYYYNRNNRSRNKINEKILNEFSLRAKPNPLLELVARLPVQSIWTTNYDTLIEDTLKKVDKIVDVKIKEKQLSLFLNNRDVTLYKIHGDKNTPDEAVITRDDYETFFQNRELFITNLLGELISKTFLFLGYSFGDPNFEQILSKIRYKLLDNSRTHYCFMRKIKLSECENEEEYKYLTLKNELRIEDLKNYNISTILVDEYDDILNSMKRIEFEVIKNNVFISGSAHDYNSFKNLTDASKFIVDLSRKLIVEKNKIISGYGIGVGGYVIDGVMSAIFDEKLRIDDHLILRPFPQHTINKQNLSEIWESHRRGSISLSSYAIFMFGNKVKEDEVVIADGVIKEFLIAEELGKYVIPIGSTGYAAKEISTMTKSNPEKYWYLTDSYCVLDESLDVDKIYEEIVKILKRIKGEI
jgi:virulence-associated protein VapD